MLLSQFASTWTVPTETVEKIDKAQDMPYTDFLCSQFWVEKELRRLRAGKATGVDGLPPRFLKTLSSALSFPLAAIINKSIMHAALPAEWKEARVCPIPKKGQSTDPADYRPVSILPAVSLVAEKHMMRFLGPAVEVGLPENQYGFRKGRGCEDALIRLESEICAGWELCRVQKPRVATKVAVVAIEMSKAFDKIPHCQLMRSLRQRFELPPCVDRWYCDFVTGRTM